MAPGAAPSADPPITSAGPDKSATTGTTVSLVGSATNSPTSYLWQQISGTAVTLSSTTSASTSFTAPGAASTLVFRLTATNAFGSSSDDVSVAVTVSGGATFTHGSQMPAALAAGQIGLKTGVSRTAVAAFTATSGTTYQDLTISGEMSVDVDCTFINCKFLATGSTNGLVNCWSNKNVVFQYCQFDGANNTDGAIKGGGVNCYRCEFRRSLKDFHGTDNVVFTECIGKEHWNKGAGDHRECVLRNSGSAMTLLRCYFLYEDMGSQNQYVSSAISCYNQPNSLGLTVQDCYVDGGAGGYAIYGGGSSNTNNIKILGNIFGRAISRYSGYVAPIEDSFAGTSGSSISGNVWGPKGPANNAGDPAEGTAI